MYSNYDLTIERQTNTSKLIFPVMYRFFIPLVLIAYHKFDSSIFGYLYFLTGLFQIALGLSAKTAEYDESKNIVRFRYRSFIIRILTMVISLGHFFFYTIYKLYYIFRVANKEVFIIDPQIYEDEAFIGFTYIKSNTPLKVFGSAFLYLMIGIFGLAIEISYKMELNYAKMKLVKGLCKSLLTPFKTAIWGSVILIIYGGQASILCLVFNICLILICINILLQSHSANKSKINTTIIARVLHKVTFMMLLLYIIFEFFSLPKLAMISQNGNKSSTWIERIFSIFLKEEILYIKLTTYSKMKDIFFKRPLWMPVATFWIISVYLHLKEVTQIAKEYERQLLRGVSQRAESYEEDPSKSWTKDAITESSYFCDVMLKNLDTIFELKSSILVKKNLTFVSKWMGKFGQGVPAVEGYFAMLKNERKNDLKKWRKITASLMVSIQETTTQIIIKAFTHIDTTVYMIVIGISIFILFQTFSIFFYSYLAWVMFSLLSASISFQINMATYGVFTIYLFETIIITLKDFYFYIKNGDETETPKWFHILAFYSLMIYSIILIFKQKGKTIDSRIKRSVGGLLNFSSDEKKSVGYNKLLNIYHTIRSQIYKQSRLIALGLGMVSSLTVASIPNFLLIMFTLVLIWKKEMGRKYWIYYVAFNIIFFIILVILIRIQIITNFNVELAALIGIYAGRIDQDNRKLILTVR